MSDIEKYGLFALVFVVGVLGLAWLLDPAEGVVGAVDQPVALRTVPVQRPSTMPAPATLPRPAGGRATALVAPDRTTRRSEPGARAPATPAGAPRAEKPLTFTAKSLTGGRGSFQPSEPGLQYPGEHSSSAPRQQGARVEHTVVKGETLGDISMRYFGTSTKWPLIKELNPGIDERALQPGQRLVVHDGHSGSPQLSQQIKPRPVTGGRQTYTVQKGDSLSAIAKKLRGAVRFTDEIFQANRDLLDSPDDIREGMVLVIP